MFGEPSLLRLSDRAGSATADGGREVESFLKYQKQWEQAGGERSVFKVSLVLHLSPKPAEIARSWKCGNSEKAGERVHIFFLGSVCPSPWTEGSSFPSVAHTSHVLSPSPHFSSHALICDGKNSSAKHLSSFHCMHPQLLLPKVWGRAPMAACVSVCLPSGTSAELSQQPGARKHMENRPPNGPLTQKKGLEMAQSPGLPKVSWRRVGSRNLGGRTLQAHSDLLVSPSPNPKLTSPKCIMRATGCDIKRNFSRA